MQNLEIFLRIKSRRKLFEKRKDTSKNEKEEQEKGSRVNKINATKKKLILKKKKKKLEDVFKCPSHKGKDSKDLYPNDLTPNPVLTQGNRKNSMIIPG